MYKNLENMREALFGFLPLIIFSTVFTIILTGFLTIISRSRVAMRSASLIFACNMMGVFSGYTSFSGQGMDFSAIVPQILAFLGLLIYSRDKVVEPGQVESKISSAQYVFSALMGFIISFLITGFYIAEYFKIPPK